MKQNKIIYIAPTTYVIPFASENPHMQRIGSTETGDVFGKETSFDENDEWFSNGVTDYTEKWFND